MGSKHFNKGYLKKVFVIVMIALLSFIFAMQSPLNIWIQNGNTSLDSSVFKTVAMYMSKGLMPYRDTFDNKGPLLYIYNYLGMQISYWRGVWVIELISLFLTFCFIYKIARLCCGRIYSYICLVVVTSLLFLYFEGGNYTEEYAMLYIAVALYVFLDYFLNDKVNKLRLIACGFSLAAVFLLRVNMISVWIVFCIAVLIKCVMKKDYGALRKFIFYFVLGISILMVPIIFWLIVNNAFFDYINDCFIFGGMYITDPQRASLLNKFTSFTFFANNTLIMIAGLYSFYFATKKKDICHYSYCIYYIFTLLLICVSGMKYEHYGMILVPLVTYPFANIIHMVEDEMNAKRPVAILAIIYVLAAIVLPPWWGGAERCMSSYAQRENTERKGTVGKVVNAILANTSEEDKIIVWGNKAIFYAATKRFPASRYSFQFPMAPINPKIYDEFFDDLEENQPEIIVVAEDRERKRIDEYINKYHYSLLDIYDEYELYRKD